MLSRSTCMNIVEPRSMRQRRTALDSASSGKKRSSTSSKISVSHGMQVAWSAYAFRLAGVPRCRNSQPDIRRPRHRRFPALHRPPQARLRCNVMKGGSGGRSGRNSSAPGQTPDGCPNPQRYRPPRAMQLGHYRNHRCSRRTRLPLQQSEIRRDWFFIEIAYTSRALP